MRIVCRNFILLAMVSGGCASNPEQPKSNSDEGSPDSAEKAVRAVISELLKVDSSTIPMDRPISEPPLKADDLDLVEIVMELEERQGVEISDAAVERYARGKLGKGPIRITPNQLVLLVKEAPKLREPKRTR